MSLIEKMMDVTSSFYRDVDKVDIELTSTKHETDSILYIVVTGKSVSMRQQIKPKHKKNGKCEIKLKRDVDIIEGIYSWCGFIHLEIKLELVTRATENLVADIKSIKYFDTPPGWITLPPLFFHPCMNITFSFVEKRYIPPDYNSILLKTLMLQNSERSKLIDVIQIPSSIPDRIVQEFLAQLRQQTQRKPAV